MEKKEAIDQIMSHCRDIASKVTSLHQLSPKLNDPAAHGEIIKALFELTKNVEVVKKQVMKSQKRDESPEM
ncbi:MAG TPA: hypothetical protein DCY13_21060 [Verrucomicrobiales bacterium]|nr:hypothetical protein [Verrucomicrobiales bacterium]